MYQCQIQQRYYKLKVKWNTENSLVLCKEEQTTRTNGFVETCIGEWVRYIRYESHVLNDYWDDPIGRNEWLGTKLQLLSMIKNEVHVV